MLRNTHVRLWTALRIIRGGAHARTPPLPRAMQGHLIAHTWRGSMWSCSVQRGSFGLTLNARVAHSTHSMPEEAESSIASVHHEKSDWEEHNIERQYVAEDERHGEQEQLGDGLEGGQEPLGDGLEGGEELEFADEWDDVKLLNVSQVKPGEVFRMSVDQLRDWCDELRGAVNEAAKWNVDRAVQVLDKSMRKALPTSMAQRVQEERTHGVQQHGQRERTAEDVSLKTFILVDALCYCWSKVYEHDILQRDRMNLHATKALPAIACIRRLETKRRDLMTSLGMTYAPVKREYGPRSLHKAEVLTTRFHSSGMYEAAVEFFTFWEEEGQSSTNPMRLPFIWSLLNLNHYEAATDWLLRNVLVDTPQARELFGDVFERLHDAQQYDLIDKLWHADINFPTTGRMWAVVLEVMLARDKYEEAVETHEWFQENGIEPTHRLLELFQRALNCHEQPSLMRTKLKYIVKQITKSYLGVRYLKTIGPNADKLKALNVVRNKMLRDSPTSRMMAKSLDLVLKDRTHKASKIIRGKLKRKDLNAGARVTCYAYLMRSCTDEGDPHLAVATLQALKNEGLFPSRACLLQLQRAYIALGDLENAEEVRAEMAAKEMGRVAGRTEWDTDVAALHHQLDVSIILGHELPSRQLYDALKSYVYQGDFHRAMEIISTMHTHGGGRVWFSALPLVARVKHPSFDALSYAQWLVKSSRRSPVPPTLTFYRSLLSFYRNTNNLRETGHIIYDMNFFGIRCPRDFVDELHEVYRNTGQFAAMATLLGRFKEVGREFDKDELAALLSYHVKRRHYEDASHLVNVIEEANVKTNITIRKAISDLASVLKEVSTEGRATWMEQQAARRRLLEQEDDVDDEE